MKANLIISLLFSIAVYGEFYDIPVSTAGGTQIDLNALRGKRILIVNIATQSRYSTQIAELQQLYEIHQDSLAILAVPTNSFGNEPETAFSVSDSLSGKYGVTFIITEKMEVKGANMHSLYRWLTDASRNGAASSPMIGDFQKFLIGKDGDLMGIFSPSVSPLSEEFLNAFKY